MSESLRLMLEHPIATCFILFMIALIVGEFRPMLRTNIKVERKDDTHV